MVAADAALAAGGDPKQVANYLTGDVFRQMNLEGRDRTEIGAIRLTPQALADLVTLVQKGTINHGVAKKLLVTIYAEGGDPAALVEAQGLAQVSDESVLADAVAAVLDDNPWVARNLYNAFLESKERSVQRLLDPAMAEPGTRVKLIWGEPDGGAKSIGLEPHRQVEINATQATAELVESAM